MENKELGKKMKVSLSNMPIDSSLGHLAIGDIAFVEWRKLKIANGIKKGTAK
ncbi:hypothetical protein [uncultured Dokdonia sp.]|uniref:hypothetical protein n=1 Tax=uncultured Dokdonia sp. TaxID=575653 RepID=UPI0026252039|nr:hypothetical protein [uncultured Dokdonia sp.]